MQKIRNSIQNRMIDAQLTNKEIMFLVCYLSRYQNENGEIFGVHYKQVCEALHISFQSFYDIKDSLEQKGFIQCRKRNRTDFDITILENSNQECLDNGYINTNHNIFFSREFQELKAGAKLLAMHLMKITFASKGHFEIGVKKFYASEDGYPKQFGVTKRVMHSYLMDIKTLFTVELKKGKYYIAPKKVIYKKADGKGEAERLREYNSEVVLRRNRIKEPGKGKKELYDLFQQYGKSAAREKKNLVELIGQAVKKSLELLNEGEARLRKRIIDIKLVHKILKQEFTAGNERLTQGDSLAQPKGMEPGVKNRFNNFPQREYDYDELERMLLATKPAQI